MITTESSNSYNILQEDDVVEQHFALLDEEDNPIESYSYDLYKDGNLHTNAISFTDGKTVIIKGNTNIGLIIWINQVEKIAMADLSNLKHEIRLFDKCDDTHHTKKPLKILILWKYILKKNSKSGCISIIRVEADRYDQVARSKIYMCSPSTTAK